MLNVMFVLNFNNVTKVNFALYRADAITIELEVYYKKDLTVYYIT